MDIKIKGTLGFELVPATTEVSMASDMIFKIQPKHQTGLGIVGRKMDKNSLRVLFNCFLHNEIQA